MNNNNMKHKQIIDKEHKNMWEFTALDNYTLHLKETISVKGKKFFQDLSNELWVYSILEVKNNNIFFKVENKVINIPIGIYAFFKPPFSLTEIGTQNCQLTLNAILSKRPLFEEAPNSPSLILLKNSNLPQDYKSLYKTLQTKPVFQSVSRYNKENVSGIAIKIKRAIENSYKEQMYLNEIAESVGITSNLMSMYFKKNFFISPSQYRKQLRIKSSVFQLLESYSTKNSIADIAFNCGYNDLSRYNKQFKSFTGVTPSQVKT